MPVRVGAKIPFDAPETFSTFSPEKNACQDKLSDLLIESSKLKLGCDKWYSKGEHTPRLLPKINPQIVKQKCPLFRQFYEFMTEFSQQK